MKKSFVTMFGASLLALLLALIPAEAAAANAAASGKDAMPALLAEYSKIHETLAKDSVAGVNQAAVELGKHAKALGQVECWRALGTDVAQAAAALAAAKDLKAARAAFKDVSTPLVTWVTKTKPPKLAVIHCPMAKASWLQADEAVRNPYHGSEMLTCGEVKMKPAAAVSNVNAFICP